MGFYTAVAWSEETWLMGLLGCEFVLLLLVIFARSYRNLQLAIFFACCSAIFMAEKLNAYAGENWKDFSTQNYFDRNGVFLGVVLGTPLLVTLTVQLLLTLYDAANLVVKVKRIEFATERKKKTS